jgi:hypothetical protein
VAAEGGCDTGRSKPRSGLGGVVAEAVLSVAATIVSMSDGRAGGTIAAVTSARADAGPSVQPIPG